MKFKRYIEKETGLAFVVITEAKSTTESTKGDDLVVYKPTYAITSPVYVKEKNEFLMYFEPGYGM